MGEVKKLFCVSLGPGHACTIYTDSSILILSFHSLVIIVTWVCHLPVFGLTHAYDYLNFDLLKVEDTLEI